MTLKRTTLSLLFISLLGVVSLHGTLTSSATANDESSRAHLAAQKIAPIKIEIESPREWIDKLLRSAPIAALKSSPEWEAWYASRDAKKLRNGLQLFGNLMDRDPIDAIRDIADRRLILEVRPRRGGTPSFLLLAETRGNEVAAQFADVLEQLAGLSGQDLAHITHRDVSLSTTGKEFHTVIDRWFLISDDASWLRDAIDTSIGAEPEISQEPRLTFHIDAARLRAESLIAPAPLRHDNALAPLLLQGIFSAWNDATTIDGRITQSDHGVELESQVQVTPSKNDEHDWAFPDVVARSVPVHAGTIGWVRIARDFEEFYAVSRDLIDPRYEGKWIEFDNVMSIFFGGRSMGDEVLAGIADDALLLIGEPMLEDLDPKPELEFPSFALVAPLRDGATRTSQWIMPFQTAIGIINADRAQNGMDSFMMSLERHRGVEVASARYLLDEPGEVTPTRFNFSPSIALCGNQLLIGSSRAQLVQLIDAILDRRSGATEVTSNTELTLRIPQLLRTLETNRRPLIANRMLEEGETRDEATLFFDRLERVIALFQEVHLDFDRSAAEVTIRASVETATGSDR